MRISSLEWDKKNIAHIAEHGVAPEEVEEVFNDTPVFLKGKKKYYYCYGQSISGRYLFIVFVRKARGLARVITARNMTNKDIKYYKKRKQPYV